MLLLTYFNFVVCLHACCSEEVIDVTAGDQHVMRYKPIAGLVSSGDAVLIWWHFVCYLAAVVDRSQFHVSEPPQFWSSVLPSYHRLTLSIFQLQSLPMTPIRKFFSTEQPAPVSLPSNSFASWKLRLNHRFNRCTNWWQFSVAQFQYLRAAQFVAILPRRHYTSCCLLQAFQLFIDYSY